MPSSPSRWAAAAASRALSAKNALARSSESTFASQGRFGGASGSSQSPNWADGTSKPSSARRAASDSTHVRMLAHWVSMTAGSP